MLRIKSDSLWRDRIWNKSICCNANTLPKPKKLIAVIESPVGIDKFSSGYVNHKPMYRVRLASLGNFVAIKKNIGQITTIHIRSRTYHKG